MKILSFYFHKLLNKPAFAVISMVMVYTAITIYLTLLMYNSYHTYAFDLGLFTQSLRYTLQGKLLWHPMTGTSELASHFSPILFILVPIYWIFPHPQMLLVIQSLTLGFSGYLAYILARDYNYSHRTSLIVEALFLLNPLVWGVALFDFHPVVFAIPALFVMFIGLKRKNLIFFGLGLFSALISREDVILAIGIFGIIQIIIDYWKNRKIDRISIIITSSAIIAYGLAILVSAATSNGGSPLILSYFTNRYTYLGQSPQQTILQIFEVVFSFGSLLLVIAYLAPLGFLPLLALRWSIPGLLIMLSGILSTDSGQHNQLMQYPAAAIPFLFVAFLVALPRIKEDLFIRRVMQVTSERIRIYSFSFLIIASLSVISAGRIDLAQFPNKHDLALDQVTAAVPSGTTVTASNDIFTHLCSRTDTYLPRWTGAGTGIVHGDWGFPDRETEYVIVDDIHKQKYLDGTYWEDAIQGELQDKYQLILNVNGAKLYKLRQPVLASSK